VPGQLPGASAREVASDSIRNSAGPAAMVVSLCRLSLHSGNHVFWGTVGFFKKRFIVQTVYKVSQELRSLLWDLIPELILSQKCHIQHYSAS